MKDEYTAEDFAKGVRNPYFHLLCKKVEVTVRNEDYALFEKMSEEIDEPISSILARCVTYYAQLVRENKE